MFSPPAAGIFRASFAAILLCVLVFSKADAETYRGRTVQTWTADLKSGDVRQRWQAAHALAEIGPPAAAAVGPLAVILAERSQFEYVRAGAAFALGRIGAEPERAVPLLTETLSSDLASIRSNSARALGRFETKAEPAVPKMLEALARDDAVFRVDLAESLWLISRHPRALPLLVDEVRSSDGPAAFEAAEALGRLAARAPVEIAPVLVEALGSANGDVARSAARSLGRAGGGMLPPLAAALRSASPAVRRHAADALVWMGTPGIAGLTDALDDSSPEVRRSAARGLGRLGTAARQAEPALLRAVSDPDPAVRSEAAAALKRISSG